MPKRETPAGGSNGDGRELVTYKDNDREAVRNMGWETEVGDDKVVDTFIPRVKISRNQNAQNFSIGLEHVPSESATHTREPSGLIRWQEADLEQRFYDVPDDTEYGSFEYEVELKTKPLPGHPWWQPNGDLRLPFTIRHKDVEFAYQPPLTQEEVASGRFKRPARVVNSYAIYSANGSRGPYAKLGHLYRPLVLDATGAKTWGQFTLDLVNNRIYISIASAFMRRAQFPLVVDPTIGYTTAGGSIETITDTASGHAASIGLFGTTGDQVTTVWVHGRGVFPPTNTLALALYIENRPSQTLPVSLVRDWGTGFAVVASGTPDWIPFALSHPLVSGQYYVLCWRATLASPLSVEVSYDNHTSTRSHSTSVGSFPYNWVEDFRNNRKSSVYADVVFTSPTVTADITRDFDIDALLVNRSTVTVASDARLAHISEVESGARLVDRFTSTVVSDSSLVEPFVIVTVESDARLAAIATVQSDAFLSVGAIGYNRFNAQDRVRWEF